MLESHEAVVGDGRAMGVTGEIAEHMMRTAEGWLGVDGPITLARGQCIMRERPLLSGVYRGDKVQESHEKIGKSAEE
jgi:hypothetical protein